MTEYEKLITAFDVVSDALHACDLTAEQYVTVYARLCTALLHGRPEFMSSFMAQLFEGLNNLDKLEQAVGRAQRKAAGV